MSTTASSLVSYRNELIEGGLPESLANEMTRDAASRIIQAHSLKTKADEE